MRIRNLLFMFVAIACLAAPLAGCSQQAPPSEFVAADGKAYCPLLLRVRILARKGSEGKLTGGRITGSNEGETNGFNTLGTVKEAPAAGAWAEVKLAPDTRYRYIKYEAPSNSFAEVAEVEFYGADLTGKEIRLRGKAFGTNGSRDNLGNTFEKALDGSPDTFFEGVEGNNQYVGLDLGEKVQVPAPTLSPKSGAYLVGQSITMASSVPGAHIRYSTWGSPSPSWGDDYKAPLVLKAPAVLAVIAYTDTLAPSPLVVGAYRIGDPNAKVTPLRTFHIGNSLTDTVNGTLEVVAHIAGKQIDFHRFTIPGAPTDWLWDHPGSGFGDGRYGESFDALAPIDDLITQPFAGHNRSVENEADYSGRFYDLCRKFSPNVQMWLYVQWPGPDFKDNWAQGTGATVPLHLKPATTWQEGCVNHTLYTEAVRERMDSLRKTKRVQIIPGGLALAELKTQVDAGKVPGITDFFPEIFADGIHLTPKGRYLIALVHYACLYKQSPVGSPIPPESKLTSEQGKIFQTIAWNTAKGYKYSGISPLPKRAPETVVK